MREGACTGAATMPQPSTLRFVDPQRRRFGCHESDFALQRLVECRALVGPVRNPVLYGTREEPGTLSQGGALFSLVPLVWESNPKLQGGWCKPNNQPIGESDPNHQGWDP